MTDTQNPEEEQPKPLEPPAPYSEIPPDVDAELDDEDEDDEDEEDEDDEDEDDEEDGDDKDDDE